MSSSPSLSYGFLIVLLIGSIFVGGDVPHVEYDSQERVMFELDDYMYGAKGVTHPDLHYVPELDEYWMYYTPFPPKQHELPSLLRSKDGITFSDEGITNPLTSLSLPEESDHVFDPEVLRDGDMWYMVYAGNNGDEENSLIIHESRDGINWENKSVLLRFSEIRDDLHEANPDWKIDKGLISPALIKKGDTVRLFFNVVVDLKDRQGEKGFIYEAKGPDIYSLVINPDPVFIRTFKLGTSPVGHHDIAFDYQNDRFILIFQGFSYEFLGVASFGVAYRYDDDGVFVPVREPILSPGKGWDKTGLYKPCLVIIDGDWWIYYSTKGVWNAHRIGRVKVQLPEISVLKGEIPWIP